MTIATTPHLNFDGDARAALDFYAVALGTKAETVTYGQMHSAPEPAWADRVMWGQVETTSGIRVMAFDVWPNQPYQQGSNSFYVYVLGDNADEITSAWNGLSDGAEVLQPIGPTGWSPLAGQLRDKFGVVWQLDLRTAETDGDSSTE